MTRKWNTRGRRGFLAALCCIGVLPLMGQDDAGCASIETVDEPDKGGEGSKEAKRPKAQLGDSLTLKGTDTKMQVTALKVLDPAPVDEFDTPTTKGGRFVGVQVLIKNVGDKTYSDSPSNGATLLLGNDSQAQGTILLGGPCAGGFASDAKISPGSQQQGCLPFEVPGNAKLKTFQFTLDSGFGPQSGEWRLR